ncbi:MAG: TerC/Alx family metal homeostasis membrane protein [Phycisphaerales bacterium]|nr:TerC/Alx family metal homeostasis membrane protein [Phycisphaerales bacterium]
MSEMTGGAPLWAWVALIGGVALFLMVDLLAMHRHPQVVGFRAALLMIVWWVAWAVVTGFTIGVGLSPALALEFASAYIVELSLSVDNVFVFAVIFQRFAVPAPLQPRVLFWGILGAIVLRGAFIGGGIALMAAFHSMLYIFGAVLLWTAWRMLRSHGEIGGFDPNRACWTRLLLKCIPMVSSYDSGKFLVRSDGRLRATPLLLVLVTIEGTDLLFAVDSIPAALAITQVPFIAFSSNLLAILGLRALYFALAGILRKIPALHIGLSVLIAGIGVKMILGAAGFAIAPVWTLVFIAATLGTTIGLGVLRPACRAGG